VGFGGSLFHKSQSRRAGRSPDKQNWKGATGIISEEVGLPRPLSAPHLFFSAKRDDTSEAALGALGGQRTARFVRPDKYPDSWVI